MLTAERRRADAEVTELARSGLDLVSYWSAAEAALHRALPGCLPLCWYTLDPTTLLITSHVNEQFPELPPEWLAEEYTGDDDLHRLADVVSSPAGLSTLHDATGGDPSRTRRWQENRALGADQELLAGLRSRTGEIWGAVGFYRPPGEPLFDRDETAFLRSVSSRLADGARRALVLGEADDPEGPSSPALLVLSQGWELESATPGAARWLSDLPDGDSGAGRLPSVVLAVAGRALAPGSSHEASSARVLTRSGAWALVHGAPLLSDGVRRAAVIVEAAAPARIAPLLMAAYGLTEREQDVARLVLQGLSTSAIADLLTVSPHTVQQHLKSVFDKTGVRSRRDLVGHVFTGFYEPRVRDNERRAQVSRPLRGGPLPAQRAGEVPPRHQ